MWRAIERTDALAPWLAHVRAEMAAVRQQECAIAAFAVRSASLTGPSRKDLATRADNSGEPVNMNGQ